MSKSYRILGGPKHGDFIQLQEGEKTLRYLVPEAPMYDEEIDPDSIIPFKNFVYEIAIFFFPHLDYDVEVLVPKGSTEMEKEAYLVNLITGRRVL